MSCPNEIEGIAQAAERAVNSEETVLGVYRQGLARVQREIRAIRHLMPRIYGLNDHRLVQAWERLGELTMIIDRIERDAVSVGEDNGNALRELAIGLARQAAELAAAENGHAAR